jgi:Rho-binding antiterminator
MVLRKLSPHLYTEPMPEYQPINCEFHDRLEDAAVRQKPVEVKFLDQGVEQMVTAKVTNVRTEPDAEYLDLEDQDPIRLDHIVSFDGEPLPTTC